MLNREYVPFQYVVVYIAVLQGGMGAGQWLSYGPSKFACTHTASPIATSNLGFKTLQKRQWPPTES